MHPNIEAAGSQRCMIVDGNACLDCIVGLSGGDISLEIQKQLPASRAFAGSAAGRSNLGRA